ncbi:MAG: hypothetical protein LBE11_04105 [Prevotellaceae bacterium]|nr:hypothetical protein [Prevotellaceae bacterium]
MPQRNDLNIFAQLADAVDGVAVAVDEAAVAVDKAAVAVDKVAVDRDGDSMALYKFHVIFQQ